MTYWVTFKDGYAGCVETIHGMTGIDHKKQIEGVKSLFNEWTKEVKEHGEVVSVESLPYPASPRLITVSWLNGGACPSFCFKPNQCKGNTSCPQNYSCTE